MVRSWGSGGDGLSAAVQQIATAHRPSVLLMTAFRQLHKMVPLNHRVGFSSVPAHCQNRCFLPWCVGRSLLQRCVHVELLDVFALHRVRENRLGQRRHDDVFATGAHAGTFDIIVSQYRKCVLDTLGDLLLEFAPLLFTALRLHPKPLVFDL